MIRHSACLAALSLLGASLCGAQPAANLAGIAHVAFRVTDLDAAGAFYHKLGFEQFFEMKQGDLTTEAFLKINDRQFLELYPRTDPTQPLGLMHVCYESNDLAMLHAEYVSRGLAVSDVRKAGAGNLLMTMKDPEGQTIEYTQYMPGSRHYEDRGKHLGEKRVAQSIAGATTLAHDVAAVRTFYVEKLGFTGTTGQLRLPGDSGQSLAIGLGAPKASAGVSFGVADLREAIRALAALGLHAPLTDPDGAAISFVKR